MDKMLVARLHRELQARRDEILRRLIVVEQEGKSMSQDCPQDSVEQSLDAYEKELRFEQNSNHRGRLQMINTALRRMHEGTFGACVQCGGEISPKRLQAMPWTQLCFACQEMLERGDLLELQAA